MISVSLKTPDEWWDVVYALRVLADRTLMQESVGEAPTGAGSNLDDLADRIEAQYREKTLEMEAQ